MPKLAIIGFFKEGFVADGGQGVKTVILTEELERVLGKDDVLRIDTNNWKKHPFSLVWKSIKAVRKCDNVIFLVYDNGIKVFPRLLSFSNFFKHTRLHYYVVGGWLNDYLRKKSSAAKLLKKFHAIYVEIPSMEQKLIESGFRNIVPVNKFRRLQNIKTDIYDGSFSKPFKLCFFARVLKEKGIEDAIEAVKIANAEFSDPCYILDIYGAVDSNYRDRFDEMKKDFPPYIQYCGLVDFHNSTSVLSGYFAMLFPTYFASEGYPNTVVDAYAAGLPIIATKWNSNEEFIRDKEDGLLVDIKSPGQIVQALKYLSENENRYYKMKANCLKRRDEYRPEIAVNKVLAQLK